MPSKGLAGINSGFLDASEYHQPSAYISHTFHDYTFIFEPATCLLQIFSVPISNIYVVYDHHPWNFMKRDHRNIMLHTRRPFQFHEISPFFMARLFEKRLKISYGSRCFISSATRIWNYVFSARRF